MDWSTLIASAGVSAVVGAVVSLFAVSQMTVRQTRAERREGARQSIANKVRPLQDQLARYVFATDRKEPWREANGPKHLGDHDIVIDILRAADDLPQIQKRLVIRRCRKVFGNYWTDLTIEYPTSEGNGNGSFSSFLGSALRGDQVPNDALTSLFHRAYSSPPGHESQRKLGRELRRLRSSR